MTKEFKKAIDKYIRERKAKFHKICLEFMSDGEFSKACRHKTYRRGPNLALKRLRSA